MASLKKLGEIDDKTKYSVYGWIRTAENELKLDYIPIMIKSICILYYYDDEVFDVNTSDIDVGEISKNKKIIAKTNCIRWIEYYGTIRIPSQSCIVCKWDIKIINVIVPGGTCVKFGVASIKGSKRANRLGDIYYVHSNYQWCRDHRKLQPIIMPRYRSGDMITVTMDLREKKVTFCNKTRDKSQEIKMDTNDEGLEYRFACALHSEKVSISMDNFTQEFF